MKFRFPTVFLLALVVSAVFAARETKAVPALKRLGTEQSLSNNFISRICSDRDGILWIATEEGLNKFDGVHFTSYYKHTGDLPGNGLNDVFCDRFEPLVWVATKYDGLVCHDLQTLGFETFRNDPRDPHSLITNDITHIEQSSSGDIWLSTYRHGLERLDKKRREFTHFDSSTVGGMVRDPIYTFKFCSDSLMCVGHYNAGITLLNPYSREAVSLRHSPDNPHSLLSDKVRCLYLDTYGRMWVGTTAGLSLFRPATRDFINIPLKISNRDNSVLAIHLKDGRLILGLEFNGLLSIDPDSCLSGGFGITAIDAYRLPGTSHLNHTSITSIHEDACRNLWIGTYGDALWFQGNRQLPKFGNLLSPARLSWDKTWGLCFDASGNLWAGTDGNGVDILSDNRLLRNCRDELTGKAVLSAFCDSDGNVWLGTYNNNITLYDSRRRVFRTVEPDAAKRHLDIRCFCQSGDEMRVGSEDGLYVIDRRTLKTLCHYTEAGGGLVSNHVRALHTDNLGRHWIGTFDAGLAVYDARQQLLTRFTRDGGLASNEINHIMESRDGFIWLATGEGLVKIDPLSLKVRKIWRRADNLQNDHIHAVAEDRNGNIWMSTNTGICCIDTRGAVYNFDHRDGGSPGTFMSGSTATSSDGTIYFGSTHGITFFRGEEMLARQQLPALRFLEVKVSNSSHAPSPADIYPLTNTRRLKLNHRQNNFTVKFGVTDYAFANKIEYSYTLNDENREWFDIGDSNQITFRHLPYGRYEIRLRARTRNQEWIDPHASIVIEVLPPVLLSWWARVGYAVLLLVGFALLLLRYQRRIRRKNRMLYERETLLRRQEINDERLRFYTNITHELKTPLTLIIGPLEDMLNGRELPETVRVKITTIHRSARQLLSLINQLLEFRKTETDNRPLEVNYGDISQYIEEMGLQFYNSNTNRNTAIILDIEKDINIYFDRNVVSVIINNLMSNALKYTPQGSVTLFLRREAERVLFGVRDTGYGIRAEYLDRIFKRYYQINDRNQASGTGIGLALVKNLVHLHHGEITVESREGQGSIFTVCFDAEARYDKAVQHTLEPAAHTKADGEENRTIILVVEDNTDIREYIAESLRDNYEVLTAEDGSRGVALAHEHIPDIIISDIMMPVMNGFELLKTLKNDIKTSHIPIILLTARETISDRTHGYDLGADSYMTKPFSSSLLNSRIKNLLDMRRKLAVKLISPDPEKKEGATENLLPLDNSFLKHLDRIIGENISSEKLDVAYLSDKLNLSPSTLYRKLKGLTGISTNEYIRKVKIRRAAELLRTESYNVSEVMWQVGINSAVYFRQCFKDEYGVSPSEYRKKMSGRRPDEVEQP